MMGIPVQVQELPGMLFSYKLTQLSGSTPPAPGDGDHMGSNPWINPVQSLIYEWIDLSHIHTRLLYS